MSFYVPATTGILNVTWKPVSGTAKSIELSNIRPLYTTTDTAIVLSDTTSNRFTYLTATANVTITTNLSNPEGSEYEFFNATSTGITVTFVAGTSCTIRSVSNKVKLTANGAAVVKCVSNTGTAAVFAVIGALE